MLVVEATRHLEIVDLFRSLGLAVTWRSEADETGVPRRARKLQRATICDRCAGALVRINGRHICLQNVKDDAEGARDVNAGARYTQRGVHHRLTALLTGCA